MAYRVIPSSRSCKLSPSPRKKNFDLLKKSIKKVIFPQYEKMLKNAKPGVFHSKNSSQASISRQRSPVVKSCDSPRNKYIETSDEKSSKDYSKYPRDDPIASPILTRIKNDFPDYYLDENQSLFNRENILINKLEKIQERSILSNQRNITTKELKQELKKQKEILKAEHKIELENQRLALKKEYEKQFEVVHEKVLNKLKNQQQLRTIKENEIHENYLNEIALLEKESEARFKLKLSEISSGYDREVKRLQDENSQLRSLNENFKRKIEDFNAKNELVRNNKAELFLFDCKTEIEREYEELLKNYNLLQEDYLKLKNKKGLCTKCKAFTKGDQELARKISNIKAFLASQN